MSLQIIGIGGYNEVGKNMTLVKYNDESVILDMGFHLPSLVDFEEQGGDRRNLTTKGLQKLGAIPDDSSLNSFKDNIKAIVPSHCHLDHVGAIPYLEKNYNAKIIGTPYTIEVLKSLVQDENLKLRNPLIVNKAGSTIEVSKNIKVEFINTTHSTPDTVNVAIHTPEGIVLYTNDFKLDNNPVIGKKPDYDRLKELGKEGKVKALLLDSLYSNQPMKTPSESVAREMLKDVMFGADNEGHAMMITTFASQIARLKSAVEFGKKLDRKIVFLGRSLVKYSNAAINVGYGGFMEDVEIVTYARQVERKLKQIEKDRSKYLVVCTGNQAEPGSILTRIGSKKLPFKFVHDDHIIFSCKTIPVSPNIENRQKLEKQLAKEGVRIFKDIHVSGHGAREDARDMIDLVKPQMIIPSHGDVAHIGGITELTEVLGYKTGKDLQFLGDGKTINIK
nr:ribonuclease J [Nanoarchaeum sp.]